MTKNFNKNQGKSSRNIVYILGAGRSGTTLLDIILGNQDGFHSCGEINRYLKRDGIPHGKKLEENSLWESVKQDLSDCYTLKEFESLRKSFKIFDYYWSFFVPKFFLKRRYTDYLDFQSRLLEAIYQNIEYQTVIVDSSKYPSRAAYLRKMGYSVKIIFLIREPISLIRSFGKKDIEQPSKSVFMAALYYTSVNILNYITFYRFPNRVKIRLEDLIVDTEGSLDNIGVKLGLNLSSLISKVKQKRPLSVGNLFDGNRIRLNDHILVNKHVKSNNLSLIERGINRALKILY